MTGKERLQRARRAQYLKETGRVVELSQHRAEDAMERSRAAAESYRRRQAEGRNRGSFASLPTSAGIVSLR
jgi:hypothetical protein